MGGKTGTTTSSVSIPPEVLARYNAVNAKADVAAGQPFQQYGTDPSAFVAQLNQQQQQGISGTNQYANAAQPAFNTALGQTNQASDTIARNQYLAQPAFNAAENQTVNATQAMQGAANMAQPAFQNAMYGTQAAYGGYNPQAYQGGVQGYMNPYLQNAVGSTVAQLNNINQQQQQSLLGNAISQGAFGGDRTNIGMANLMNQQNLAMGQTIGGMENQGYQAAAQNYMSGLSQQGALANQMGQLGAQQQAAALQGQQAVLGGANQLAGLGAAQQTAALQGVPLSLGAANQMGQIGAQQQASGLQGAQAQLGAGTLGQQTEQAGKTALYNQYQQQQAYPFQVSQFLAGIAGITGPNSGSTTTTTSPTSFFSDRRLKEDIKRVGTAENGLPIYKFKYKGDPAEQTHIGFMADEVEKIHPEAVGELHGFKTVDYDRAARYAGGLVRDSEGGAVTSNHMGEGYASGGYTDPSDMASILASQQQSYAPFQQSGLYGATSGGTPGVKGYVQAPNLPVGHLAPAAPPRTGEGETLAGNIHEAANMGDDVKKLNQYRKDLMGQKVKAATATTDAQGATGLEAVKDWLSGQQQQGAYRGGLVHAYADGGDVLPYDQEDPMSDIVRKGEKDLITSKLLKPTTTPTSGSSTASDIGTAVNLGKDAMWLASLFSNGGRAGYEDGGNAQPNYASMAEDAARNAGIDPAQYRKLIQGESGFQLNPGDENSSAGLLQMHVSGASQKYPNPGLGDAYIAERNPELAKTGTPEQKISYLNSAENQPDILNWGANHIAKHGANAWTVARQQGLLGATSSADRPAENAMPAQAASAPGAQGFQPPEGGTQPKSLGDMLTSENTLIPLLSGLGAMAGSKSRYLGSAILEGIGAGANSYEDVQQNILNRQLGQPIVQQRNMVNANALSSGLIEYNATRAASGLPPVSLEEYARVSGYKGPLPQGGSAATGQAQPSSGYNYTLPEMNNLMIDRGGVQIPAMSDPAYLRAFIAHNAGIQTPYIKNAVESAQHNLDQINSTQRTQNAAGESINAPGAIGTGQEATYAGQKMDTSRDYVNKAIAFSDTARNVKSQLGDLENVYSQFRAGADAPARASFSKLMDVIDRDQNYPSLHNTDAAHYQEALKGAAALITNQLAGMPAGAPKSELEALAKQISDPRMQPEAVHKLISRAKAAVDYQSQMYSGYDPKKENFDVQSYQRKYQEANPWEEFKTKVEGETLPAAGMPKEAVSKSGKPIVFRNGQWEYK